MVVDLTWPAAIAEALTERTAWACLSVPVWPEKLTRVVATRRALGRPFSTLDFAHTQFLCTRSSHAGRLTRVILRLQTARLRILEALPVTGPLSARREQLAADSIRKA